MNKENFRQPLSGEIVPMKCIACNHKAGGKLPKRSIFGKIKPIKCPSCRKKTFVIDKTVLFWYFLNPIQTCPGYMPIQFDGDELEIAEQWEKNCKNGPLCDFWENLWLINHTVQSR